jgi:hypothetical protein
VRERITVRTEAAGAAHIQKVKTTTIESDPEVARPSSDTATPRFGMSTHLITPAPQNWSADTGHDTVGSSSGHDEQLSELCGAVVWTDPLSNKFEELADENLLDRELYLAQRSRVGNNYRGRRNYNGLHWFSNTGAHIWYESMMERSALLWLDFHHDIVAIASQPMLMHFPDGSRHYPDFLALHANGRQVVYNVKPARFFTDKVRAQFENAAQLCKTVGWRHEVISDFDPTVINNLEWLSHFRQNHYAPTTQMRDEFLASLTTPTTVSRAAELLTSAAWTARLAALYHLAWYGYVTLDLSTPLSNNTIIRKAHS